MILSTYRLSARPEVTRPVSVTPEILFDVGPQILDTAACVE
jgi:hypothetical protein